MQKVGDLIIDNREIKEIKQSSIDNRVKGIHAKLCSLLHDDNYNLGHTSKIVGRFSEAEIYQVADYCVRKANHPGKAFVALFEKKLAQ